MQGQLCLLLTMDTVVWTFMQRTRAPFSFHPKDCLYFWPNYIQKTVFLTKLHRRDFVFLTKLYPRDCTSYKTITKGLLYFWQNSTQETVFLTKLYPRDCLCLWKKLSRRPHFSQNYTKKNVWISDKTMPSGALLSNTLLQQQGYTSWYSLPSFITVVKNNHVQT